MPAAEERGEHPGSSDAAELCESLQAALFRASEPERYRLLASFLAEFAGRQEASLRNRDGQERERLEALTRRLTHLGEEKAHLEDALTDAHSAIKARAAELELAQRRCQELERRLNEQTPRLQAAQKEFALLEQQLAAQNAQLHQAHTQVEELRLKLQRAELAAADTARLSALEDARRKLLAELDALKGAHEQLRVDKDAELAQVADELRAALAAVEHGGEGVLVALWDRLAQAKPPLAPGGIRPNLKAAERLVDAFIELTRFADEFDQAMQPWLDSFTKHNPRVAQPWKNYAAQPRLAEVIRRIIDVEHGRQAAVLRARLRDGLWRWIRAAIVSCASAMASIAEELEDHLKGPEGMGPDKNRKLSEYLRANGPDLFRQRIQELRSRNLGEAYAHPEEWRDFK